MPSAVNSIVKNEKSNLEVRIQNLIFLEGLSIRAENREDLAKKVNGVFDLILVFLGVEVLKIKKTIKILMGVILKNLTNFWKITIELLGLQS